MTSGITSTDSGFFEEHLEHSGPSRARYYLVSYEVQYKETSSRAFNARYSTLVRIILDPDLGF